MELGHGNTLRCTVVRPPRPKSRYGPRGADGRAPVVGVETDGSGTPLATVAVTMASPMAGWVEGTTVVAPEPLLADLSESGVIVELSGDLRLSIRGGDFGSTRVTVTGVTGVRVLGSAVDAIAAVGASGRRSGGEG